MGVPLLMEPNFSDYSCQVILTHLFPSNKSSNSLVKDLMLQKTEQHLYYEYYLTFVATIALPWQFKFGVLPPLPEDDAILKEPCLEICPNATRRRELAINAEKCPKAWYSNNPRYPTIHDLYIFLAFKNEKCNTKTHKLFIRFQTLSIARLQLLRIAEKRNYRFTDLHYKYETSLYHQKGLLFKRTT